MEAIKAKIHTTVTASVGPCTVRIIPSDRCIVITLDAHPRHLIFVQPDRMETCFLCHYAHAADLESTVHRSAETQDWLQQQKLQLVRRYEGRPSDFAPVALAYARAAAEHMELWKGVDGGRRVMPVQRTFEEMKKWEHHFPRPQPPPQLPAGGGVVETKEKKPLKCIEKPGSGRTAGSGNNSKRPRESL